MHPQYILGVFTSVVRAQIRSENMHVDGSYIYCIYLYYMQTEYKQPPSRIFLPVLIFIQDSDLTYKYELSMARFKQYQKILDSHHQPSYPTISCPGGLLVTRLYLHASWLGAVAKQPAETSQSFSAHLISSSLMHNHKEANLNLYTLE